MTKLTIVNRYGIIPNNILNNKNLSFKAKGLFGYLQSKPDDWDFAVSRIVYDTNDGKDGISAGLKELEKTGYLIREKTHGNKGQRETNYILSENPVLENPVLENPLTENPLTENPSSDNPEINKEIYINKEISNKDLITNKYIISKDIIQQSGETEIIIDTIEKKECLNKQLSLNSQNLIKEKKSEKIKNYGNPEINEAIEIVKKFNDGIVDGTVIDQRNYSKNLISKLKTLNSVKSGDYTRQKILEIILEIVSKNNYHSHKISSPKKVYYNLAELMQICKQSIDTSKRTQIIEF